MIDSPAFLDALARASLGPSLALGVVFAFGRICQGIPGRVQCWLWRVAFANLLLALFVAARVEIRVWTAPPPPVPVELPVLSSEQLGAPIEWPAPAPGPQRSIQLSEYLVILWTLGAVCGVAFLGIDGWRARKLRRGSRPIEDQTILRDATLLAQCFGLKRAPLLGTNATITMPLLLGIARPLILLPSSLEPPKVRLALAHELAHLHRRDLLWNCLPALAQLIFFFHPFFWLARREYRVAQELACDQAALQVLSCGPAEYASGLLDIAVAAGAARTSLFSAGIVENHKALKRRIASMKYIQVRGPARALSALAVAAVLISAVPFRLVGQSAETPPKSAAPPENASGKRGLVRPAALSARRAGVVEKIFFREGDPVKKGEVLLQIDAREAQATLATAEARFRLAEATFRVEAAAHHNALRELKRQQQLAQVGRLDANDISDESLIQAKFDRAQAEFELAKHALAQNQMELNYYRIISPRDGTVLKLDAEEGETVVASADRPLLVVGDAETAEMRRAQLEQQIQILEDQKAELRLRYTESHPRMREIDEQIAALHFKTSPKAPTHVFVLGEVNKPGAFLPLSSEHLTIFGLLARAGGLSSRANPAKIKFTRPGESERVFSLADLKKPEHQFAVEPGDMVEVVSKLF